MDLVPPHTPELPPPGDGAARRGHPRVIVRHPGGEVDVLVLPPTNPFAIKQLAPLLLVPPAASVFYGLMLTRGPGAFVTAHFLAMAAWGVAAVPPLVRGLHGRAVVTVTPRALRVTTGLPGLGRTRSWQRWQVDGVDVGRSSSFGLREMRIHFRDQAPLVLMTGWPPEHVRAAAGAVCRALDVVAPVAPTLRTDNPAILPYAGQGRSYRIEIRPLPDGVTVTVPPLPGGTVQSVGILCFLTAWLAMAISMFLSDLRRGSCAALPFFAFFAAAGVWGVTTAVVAFLRRHEPTVLAATPDALWIDDPARLRRRRRTLPAVRAVGLTWVGERKGRQQPVLRVTAAGANKPVDLLAGRDEEEIRRVADAVCAAMGLDGDGRQG